ncbi:hypothetical protein J2S00_003912 [Caldalkalibacillus uzonensis]|uniref:Transposase DDE domain-containing protein n=1 Tax=Caldalkalibacillus uzonensis TaxID=353224 RepID=A0ABU0CY52_9BACI|nr:hypothetical protein [Caldalkalibacillus uzonensis]
MRKKTIEGVFADLKEKHGMYWITLRGKNTILVFAAMNLKKLATWKGKQTVPLFFCLHSQQNPF